MPQARGLVIFVLGLATQLWAKNEFKLCAAGDPPLIRKTQGFLIEISSHPDKFDSHECLARILDNQKRTVFSAADHGFTIVLTGKDVNGDGIPDVVLEGYSGGAHCCWTYYVVSLGEKPGLIKKFENDRPASFAKNKATAKMEIKTLDGAFDSFLDFRHACSPFPEV